MDKIERLTTDLDFRLSELWLQLPPEDEWSVDVIAAFLRAAYGRGYTDALVEESLGQRAKLCKDNGYREPGR